MNELKFTDLFGASVVFTESVQSAVLIKHPEVAVFLDLIGDVLRDPDEIRRSVRDGRVVLYYRYEERVFNGKWLVVVVKQVDENYVSTVYMTDKLKPGDVVWTR